MDLNSLSNTNDDRRDVEEDVNDNEDDINEDNEVKVNEDEDEDETDNEDDDRQSGRIRSSTIKNKFAMTFRVGCKRFNQTL